MPEVGGGDGGEVPALIPDCEPLREEVPVLCGGGSEPRLERGEGHQGRHKPWALGGGGRAPSPCSQLRHRGSLSPARGPGA